jgi:hypothetical protein
MDRTKKILLAILVVLIMIQFIQPAHNKSEELLPTDITKTISIPGNVQALLKTACYDCHSNNSNYPWYAYVQPMGWMLKSHIQKGKADLNFSEFGSYSVRKQKSKLRLIVASIHDDEMPLSSYKMMHKSARLSNGDKALIIDWATKTKDSLSAKIRRMNG